MLALYPDGVPTSPQPGRLYAWSELMVEGQATVSRVETTLAERRYAGLEFMVSSGEAGYIANVRLLASDRGPPQGASLSSEPETLYFDEPLPVVRADERVPLDRALFTWRAERDGRPATVRLIPQSLDGAPDGYRICWLMQYAGLNRLACSVHDAPYAAHVVDDQGGTITRLRTIDGVVPWVAEPPAGTPAPAPVAGPIRYAFGTSVEAAVLAAPFGSPPSRSVDLVADDGSGSSARLTSTVEQLVGDPAPFGAARTTIDSVVDAARPASISYRWAYCFRLCPFTDLTQLALTAEGRTTTLASPSPRILAEAIYPLDRTLFSAAGDGALATLLLQSIDRAPSGHRVCWRLQAGTVDRLVCSVREVPGSTAYLVDTDAAGRTRNFR